MKSEKENKIRVVVLFRCVCALGAEANMFDCVP